MEELLKRCKGCEQDYPATPEYWNKNAACKDGLVGKCKKCTSARDKARRDDPEAKERIRIQRKEYRSRPEIREHIQAYHKEYNVRPEVQEHRKAYREEHSPEIQAYMKEYYPEYYARQGIKDRIIEQHREYQARPEVKEHTKAYQKEYQARPETREQQKKHRSRSEVQERLRIDNRNRRAHKKSIQGRLTPRQIREQFKRQKGRCYYGACGHAKFKKIKGKYIYHIEHTFPLSRVTGTNIPANSADYIVLACPTCNMSKGDKFPWEWVDGGRLC